MEMEPKKHKQFMKEIQRDLARELRELVETKFINEQSTEQTFVVMREEITNFLLSVGAYNIVEFFEINISSKNGTCYIRLEVPEHKFEKVKRVLFTPDEQRLMDMMGFNLHLELERVEIRNLCLHKNLELEEWNYPEYVINKCKDCGMKIKYNDLSFESYEEGFKDGENDR
ncbi:hypothetical protein [Bacillus phage YungSlug]|nr:hypothetical protein [Bacillus phage YungSlug]